MFWVLSKLVLLSTYNMFWVLSELVLLSTFNMFWVLSEPVQLCAYNMFWVLSEQVLLNAYNICFGYSVSWFCFVLFDLFLYVPSTIFQLNRDGFSWVEPVLS